MYGNPAERDEPNAFVELLWEQGVDHEARIVADLGVTTTLRAMPAEERERETRAAIARGDALVYGGRLTVDDLVGEPDLLERRGDKYVPGDIKSGSGLEGDDDDAKLKRHYAYQLGHYVHILENLGFADGSREAFIIDRTGTRVPYVLTEPQGVRNPTSWWDAYQAALTDVRALVAKQKVSRAALSATCKLCHWYTHCKDDMVATDDLTLVAELGRAKRDVMIGEIASVHALAACDPSTYIDKKKTRFPGIGPDSLIKFHERAKLLTTDNPQPYLKAAISLPISENEVFFDIEADPMRDVVYLHGFVERKHADPRSAGFIQFFAEGAEAMQEEAAFRAAWAYLSLRSKDSTIYYYSKYERTAYRKLAEKFPGVCSRADVDALFELETMIDLYAVVKSSTEWPTYDQSIKTLAQFAGFKWRDTHPSGAASIEWFHRYTERQDEATKIRILEYNEDDCLATGVVLDKVRSL